MSETTHVGNTSLVLLFQTPLISRTATQAHLPPTQPDKADACLRLAQHKYRLEIPLDGERRGDVKTTLCHSERANGSTTSLKVVESVTG